MYNETCHQLGVKRNCIRELFEFGRQRAAVVGAENVFDYSLGNPSLPAPPEVNRAIHDILNEEDSLVSTATPPTSATTRPEPPWPGT